MKNVPQAMQKVTNYKGCWHTNTYKAQNSEYNYTSYFKSPCFFRGRNLPKPCIVVIAYTGHASFSENYPPTFITVSEDDGIVNVSVVDRRVQNLRNAGIEVEYRRYKNAGHGFGIGVGMDAEGWLKHATQF